MSSRKNRTDRKFMLLILNKLNLYMMMAVLLASARCGEIKIGEAGKINDPVPDGVLVGQGLLTGQNGKSVSGTASVFRLSATGAHALRLEALSVPAEAGLKVSVETQAERVFTAFLKSSSGNQNYSFTVSVAGGLPVFSTVKVESSAVAAPENLYGSALLK